MLGNTLAYASATCLLFALGGCAVFQGSVSQPPSSGSQPARENSYEISSQDSGKNDPSGPAVIALMKQAEEYVVAKEFQQAGAALERAMRIEPKNPLVYSRLAGVLLVQEQPEQAETMARKSNSLARNWPALEAKNWMTISRSLRLRGENASADAAEMRAKQLKRQSGK